MKNNYLVQAWLVLGLALLFGAALAGVEAMLAGKIKANKDNETLEQIPRLVDGSTGGIKDELAGRVVYRATDDAGKQVGWVVPASGQGFADRIDLLIGLSSDAETITGLYVLANKETPGLGNKIAEPQFQQRFRNQRTGSSLKIVKETPPPSSGRIEAVTGATISSESVTDIVNDTVAELKGKLAATVKQ